MQLTRLQLRQLRRFHDGIVLDQLTPGINLIHGPNESGKSTLVRALRAAFFERHGTTAVSDLVPWGDTGAAPQVEVEFLWQGQTWRLAKRFLKQKRCDLTIGTASLDGEAAEARLSELLGFDYPQRGASAAHHWGVPGLLWIEQGKTHELSEPARHAGQYLQSALGHDLGTLASSTGDALLATVQSQRDALLTAAGKPRGELAKAHDNWQNQASLLATLNNTLRHYRADVDQLAELQQEHTRQQAEQPWLALRAQQQQVRQQLAEVATWQAQEATDRQTLQWKQSQLELVQQRQAEHLRERDERQRRQASVSQTQEAAVALQQAHERQQHERASAEAQYQAARQELAQLRQQHERLRDQHTLQQTRQQLQQLQQRLQQARELQTAEQATQAELAGLLLTATDLKTLRQLARKRDDLTLQQRLSATRLRYELPEGQSVHLDGQALAGKGEQLLLRETQVQLPGGGTLHILPGGEDLAELERQAQGLNEAWQHACEQWQIQSLAQAELQVEKRQQLQAALKHQQALWQPLAPQGLAALEHELQALQSRLQPLQARCDAHQPANAPALPDEATLASALAAAETAELAAEQRLRATERALQTTATELASAQAAHQQAQAEWQAVQQRPLPADDAAAQWRNEADALGRDIATLTGQLAAHRARIDAAHPEILQQDIERLGRSAEGLENQAQQRELRLVELQTRLRTLSAQGLEEQHAEIQRDHDYWQRRYEELEQHSQALSYLLNTLQRHRLALTQRLQTPLQQHLQRYLSLWQPEARLSLNEQLIPERLIRLHDGDTEQGNLEALSHGAREQLGLIARLAYADLLRDAGQPTLVVLDDALTHSDPRRLDAMKRILFDAGQRHQILLFTCHPQTWQDLGVPARELAQLPRPTP